MNAIGHHDASACLIHDGQLTAFAEEERFSRRKHAIGELPYNAVQFCLHQAGITLADVDYIATPWLEEEGAYSYPAGADPAVTFGIQISNDSASLTANHQAALKNSLIYGHALPPVGHVSHHLAHAASAYRCTEFTEATIIVVDGEGDRVSTSVAHGTGGTIQLLDQYPTAQSLGQWYARVTNFIGMGSMGEGKMMGLAAYGLPPEEMDYVVLEDERYRLRLDVPGNVWNPKEVDWLLLSRSWDIALEERYGSSIANRYDWDLEECRRRNRPGWHPRAADIAAATQDALEQALCHLVRIGIRRTGSSNVVLAGGVALNCSANSRIAKMPEVDGLFIQPIAGDAGAPIGAALELYARLGGTNRCAFTHTFFGPEFSDESIAKFLDRWGLSYTQRSNIASDVAHLLTNGSIVGWFQGRMEGGPRALGHRSILANPAVPGIGHRVNQIKHRETWRPLAPSLREENMPRLFGASRVSPFMIVAYDVQDATYELAPSIVHVDGSARPQSVSKVGDSLFWHLIDEFEDLTGVPCVLNTSFNDDYEPIVCTPADAVRTFVTSELDALAIGSFLVRKS